MILFNFRFMAYNADILTAKTPLKRLLSLHRAELSLKDSYATARSFPITDINLNKAALLNSTNRNHNILLNKAKYLSINVKGTSNFSSMTS